MFFQKDSKPRPRAQKDPKKSMKKAQIMGPLALNMSETVPSYVVPLGYTE